MHTPAHSRMHSHGGFTLAELLFAMAIGAFVVAGVMTSYIFSVRGFRGLSNYNEMQSQGRQSLDWFGRDVRLGIAVSSCTSSQVVLLLPKTVNSSGQVTATNAVTHRVQSGYWYRTDGAGKTKQLAESLTSMKFSIYDRAGNVTTQAPQAVIVQLDAFLAKSVRQTKQNSEFLSARYRMRNAP